MQVNLEQIVANEKPIRTTWSEEEMQQLMESIKQWGVIQPVKLRPILDDMFEIVDGHRRVEASRRAGMEYIEASIEGMDDQTALIQSLIANIQREDMSPPDIGHGLFRLREFYESSDGIEYTDYMLAKKVGKSHKFVEEHLQYARETQKVQDMMRISHDSNRYSGISKEHVSLINRVGIDEDTKIAILEKAHNEISESAAKKHGLTFKETVMVAEAVKVADELGDTRAKEALIAEPYSPFMHDPEIVRKRHERFKNTNIPDPMYIRTDNKRSFVEQQQNEWERLPEAKMVLDYIKKWNDKLVPDFMKASEVGKLSPEGKLFLARRVKQFIATLEKWHSELER